MEYVSADQSGDACAASERGLTYAADIVTAIVVRRRGETCIIAIALVDLAVFSVAEVGKTIQLDVNRHVRRRNDPRGRPVDT